MSHTTFLDDTTYARAIESFVVVTTDAIIVERSQQAVWLARRCVKPFPDWWIIGGRLCAGEDEREGMRRSFARETGLMVAPGRFRLISFKRYLHSEREQKPQNTGSDCLSYTFSIELTPEERAMASQKLHPSEYDAALGLREFNREEILHEFAGREGAQSAALLDMYDEIFSRT